LRLKLPDAPQFEFDEDALPQDAKMPRKSKKIQENPRKQLTGSSIFEIRGVALLLGSN